MDNPQRLSLMAALKGISNLYLIILGVGIGESLVSIPVADCNWTFFSYLFLLFGYLSMVFRFSLETMILLEYATNLNEGHWELSQFLVTVLMLLSSVVFYLMGHNISKIDQFVIYAIAFLILDLMIIYFSHRPWEKGGVLFKLKKGLSILTAFRVCSQYDPEKTEGLSPEKCQVKRTHYQWIRSNVYLILVLLPFAGFESGNGPGGVCPIHAFPYTLEELITWMQYLPQKLWLAQIALFVILFGFSCWDMKANYTYYFGPRHQRVTVPDSV